MIVPIKPLDQLEATPMVSDASYDGRFVSSYGENQPSQYVERREGEGGVVPSRPWTATPNGDEFVNVATGSIYGFRPRDEIDGTYPNGFPMVMFRRFFAGGDVEVEKNGYIYGKVSLTPKRENFAGPIPDPIGDELYSDIYQPTGAITIYFSEDAPDVIEPPDADELHFPIAQVALESGVARVVSQILEDNIQLQIDMNFVFYGS